MESEITKWFDILKLYSLTYEEITNLTEDSIHNVILFYEGRSIFYRIKELLKNNYYRFKIERIGSSINIQEIYYINIYENFIGEIEDSTPTFSHNITNITVVNINETIKPIIELISSSIQEEEKEKMAKFLNKVSEITKDLKIAHGI